MSQRKVIEKVIGVGDLGDRLLLVLPNDHRLDVVPTEQHTCGTQGAEDLKHPAFLWRALLDLFGSAIHCMFLLGRTLASVQGLH